MAKRTNIAIAFVGKRQRRRDYLLIRVCIDRAMSKMYIANYVPLSIHHPPPVRFQNVWGD